MATRLTLDALNHRRMKGTLVHNLAVLARKHERDSVQLGGLLIAHVLRRLANNARRLLAHAALPVKRIGNRRGRKPCRSADLTHARLCHA